METHALNLENQKKTALASRDGVKFVYLCDALGIKPEEAPELYEEGLAELIFREKLIQKNIKYAPESVFIKEASGYDAQNLTNSAEEKARILRECFPGRFGHGSKQDLSQYDNAAIGVIFRETLRYYQKKGSNRLK